MQARGGLLPSTQTVGGHDHMRRPSCGLHVYGECSLCQDCQAPPRADPVHLVLESDEAQQGRLNKHALALNIHC